MTVKPVDAALPATPAMLLSGTVDVRKNFTLQAAGQRDGLDWVLVEPAGADADFKDALFGFANGDLKRMILEDKLGQTATILFDHIERNAPVNPQDLKFTPPKGADVIGTPREMSGVDSYFLPVNRRDRTSGRDRCGCSRTGCAPARWMSTWGNSIYWDPASRCDVQSSPDNYIR